MRLSETDAISNTEVWSKFCVDPTFLSAGHVLHESMAEIAFIWLWHIKFYLYKSNIDIFVVVMWKLNMMKNILELSPHEVNFEILYLLLFLGWPDHSWYSTQIMIFLWYLFLTIFFIASCVFVHVLRMNSIYIYKTCWCTNCYFFVLVSFLFYCIVCYLKSLTVEDFFTVWNQLKINDLALKFFFFT